MCYKGLCLVIMSGLLVGCATDSGRTKAEGTGVGAVLGAVVGGAIGYLSGGEEGAIIGAASGAAVGGVAGYTWGAHVAKKKEAYASREEYLDAVIQEIQAANEQTQRYNVDFTQHVQQLQRETKTLKQQYRQKKVQKERLQAKYQEAERTLITARKQLDAVNSAIHRQHQILNEEKPQAQQSMARQTRLSTLSTQIQRLEQQRHTLEQQTTALTALQTQLKV